VPPIPVVPAPPALIVAVAFQLIAVVLVGQAQQAVLGVPPVLGIGAVHALPALAGAPVGLIAAVVAVAELGPADVLRPDTVAAGLHGGAVLGIDHLADAREDVVDHHRMARGGGDADGRGADAAVAEAKLAVVEHYPLVRAADAAVPDVD